MSEQSLAKKESSEIVQNTEQTTTALISIIERAASNPDVDIDKMERLLNMQERVLDRQAEEAFNAAMMQCQSEIPAIQKDKDNKQTNSRYATLEAINLKITPVYTRNGFSLSFGRGESDIEGWHRTICEIAHCAGHKKIHYFDLPLDNVGMKGTPNKTAVHAVGSTASYARRYLTCLIFNLVIDDDVDGNLPVDTISEDQALQITAFLDENNLNKEKFLNWLEAKNFMRIADIPAHSFKSIMDSLKGTVAKKNQP